MSSTDVFKPSFEGFLPHDQRAEEQQAPDLARITSGDPIRYVERVSEADLRDVLTGKKLAVVQHSYIPTDICEHVSSRIVKNGRMDGYEVEKGVHRHGHSLYDLAMRPELADAYFEDAVGAMRDLQNVHTPYGSIVDRMHIDLDLLWPAGAKTMSMRHKGQLRKVKRGTAREFLVGQRIHPHCDNFGFDVGARFPHAPKVQLQLSVNAYTQVGDGGELVLFPRLIHTPAEEQTLRDPSSRYGLCEELLGEPAVILPKVGDLIIFCANRAHAVRPSFGRSRVTLSLFAGFIDDGLPLELFN